MKKINLRVTTLSPLHLGSGKADVVLDAEVVHDQYGMPYFPGKRFKGLLYESALEMAEMSQEQLFTKKEVDEVFGREGAPKAAFVIPNLYLKNYQELVESWEYLQDAYSSIFTKDALLEAYTDIRYQTAIDDATGTAKDGSLRNTRVVNKGLIFTGNILFDDTMPKSLTILEQALLNLRYAGAKRNRGFGHIQCAWDVK